MAEIFAETGNNNDETNQEFVSKIDLACSILRNPNQYVEGYGSGAEAAYKLLCEAQAMAPENQAIAAEINNLRNIMLNDSPDNTTTMSPDPAPVQAAPEDTSTTRVNSPDSDKISVADRIMQHWKTKPVIEVLVCVKQAELKGLADTIDSISAQVYSNWKLTVISNLPSPDPVFSQHDILEWIQTDDFQAGINQAVNSSTADWLGLIPAGGSFDPEALFSIANHDNLIGDEWQVIYSDEDHLDENGNFVRPVVKPDFDTDHFSSKDHIGELCFIRKPLVQLLGGFHINIENSNNDLVFRALNMTSAANIGHIPSILFHRPRKLVTVSNSSAEYESNVA